MFGYVSKARFKMFVRENEKLGLRNEALEFRNEVLEQEVKGLKGECRRWERMWEGVEDRIRAEMEKEDRSEGKHWRTLLEMLRRCMWYDDMRREWVVPEVRVNLLSNTFDIRNRVKAFLAGEPLKDQWGQVRNDKVGDEADG